MELPALLEALLLVSSEPIRAAQVVDRLELTVPASEVESALQSLSERYLRDRGGLVLLRVAGGWQLRTHPDAADAVRRFMGQRPTRLSRASLEVLAIVAYQQPSTRAEVEAVRGVDSGAVIRGLLERELLAIAGRRREPGRPMEYRTTAAFLALFGLARLADLPPLREFSQLMPELMGDQSRLVGSVAVEPGHTVLSRVEEEESADKPGSA